VVAELLPMLGSAAPLLTLLMWDLVPAAPAVATMMTVAVLPGVSDPRVHVTAGWPVHPPREAADDTHVIPEGTDVRRTTSSADTVVLRFCTV
jgi:hypothetical protein